MQKNERSAFGDKGRQRVGEEKSSHKKEPFLEVTWEGLKERIKNIKDEELLLVTWKEDMYGK